MKRKVILIGVDAANRYLVEDWAREGLLPTWQALFQRGLKGKTISLPGVFTGATWPSFQTGVNPARSGVYSWMQVKPGSYAPYRCYVGDELKREPFWNHLSRAGRRVAVLDIPLAGLTRDLNGVQLVEWGTHDAQYGFVTWPPSLAREVEARFGRHPLGTICNADRGTEDFIGFREQLLGGIRVRTQITRHFLQSGEWDFFAQVFSESHCVGHQCWHLHDPSHPRHDPEQARAVGNPIKDVYVAIDAALGEILKDIDDETTVIVLASHGMGYKYGPQILLDQILLRLGVAAPAITKQAQEIRKPRRRDRIDPLLTRAWQSMPHGLRELLRPIRNPLREWMMPEEKSRDPVVDSAASRCFSVENNHAHAGIRVNVEGREPQGKVKRGPELDDFCAELVRDLMDIVDLDTGKPVVSRVLRTDDLYKGDYRDYLPDLLVEWASDRPVSKVRLGSTKIGELEGEYRFCRTGDHFPGGLFVAVGPGIKPGVMDRTVSIMDFAPTVAQLLDVDLPDVDGKPIHEILSAIPALA